MEKHQLTDKAEVNPARDHAKPVVSNPRAGSIPGPICTACVAPDVPLSASIELGEPDPYQEIVTRIFISRHCYVIFATAGPDGSKRKPGQRHIENLRFVLPKDPRIAQDFFDSAAQIEPKIGLIKDTLCGCGRPGSLAFRSLKERAFDLMALAYQLAFDEKGERKQRAHEVLDKLLDFVRHRRNSVNRIKYVLANTVSLVLIVLAWTAARPLAELSGLTLELPLSEGSPQQFHVADVLVLGALGAFFSVSRKFSTLTLEHSITASEIIYTGFIRVPIGLIAATVMIFLIQGGWILGAIDDNVKLYSMLLFGFIAGFAESFVPNLLDQVQANTRAKEPTFTERTAA